MKIKSIAATLCLFTGMAIYALFRSRNLLGFSVAERLGMGAFVNQIRHDTAQTSVPYFIKYCLPDALWATAYIIIADAVFCKSGKKQRWLWASAIPLIGASSELLQLPGIIPGTFDWLDLLCYLLPLIVYTLIINIKIR